MKEIVCCLMTLYAFDPLHAQWVKTSGPDAAKCFAVSGTNLFAGTWGSGVFLSSNNGASWTAVNTGLTSGTDSISCFAVSGTNLFAGTWGGRVFLSTNNGTSWSQADSGLPHSWASMYALTVSGTNLFAGTYDAGVFLSTNDGASWTSANTGLTCTNVMSLVASGTDLFAGTWANGVFLSTNNGQSWAATGLTHNNVEALAISGTNLYAGCAGSPLVFHGAYLSTNNGTTWAEINTGLASNNIYSLAISGTSLFAGTQNGVFLLNNNGASWTAVNSGMPDSTEYFPVSALALSGNYLFGAKAGVWRRPLSEMVTSIGRLSTELPRHFTLEQNYPNPFNPATLISYELPVAGKVTLKVFDLLGREVATLVNEEQSAGRKQVKWNGQGISSGVYFYRLEAGGTTAGISPT